MDKEKRRILLALIALLLLVGLAGVTIYYKTRMIAGFNNSTLIINKTNLTPINKKLVVPLNNTSNVSSSNINIPPSPTPSPTPISSPTPSIIPTPTATSETLIFNGSGGGGGGGGGFIPPAPAPTPTPTPTPTPAVVITPKLIICNATGVNKSIFYPGDKVYIRIVNATPNKTFKIYIQLYPVSLGDKLNASKDPSGTQEIVTTDSTGKVGPTLIWAIPKNTTYVNTKWDVVADNLAGTPGVVDSTDIVNSLTTVGFTVLPLPELTTMALIATGFAAVVLIKRRRL